MFWSHEPVWGWTASLASGVLEVALPSPSHTHTHKTKAPRAGGKYRTNLRKNLSFPEIENQQQAEVK